MKRGFSTRSVAWSFAMGGGWLLAALSVAQPGEFHALPNFEGKHEVSAKAGSQGARLSLRSGFSVVLPEGLPLAADTPLVLRIARERVRGRWVAAGFVPIGPSVSFDVAVTDLERPLTVSFEAKRFGVRAGHRVVLAVETSSGEAAASAAGATQATFRLEDARYDSERGQVMAEVRSLSGLRLQFGSVPVDGGGV